jgi:stage II sporulation protein D
MLGGLSMKKVFRVLVTLAFFVYILPAVMFTIFYFYNQVNKNHVKRDESSINTKPDVQKTAKPDNSTKVYINIYNDKTKKVFKLEIEEYVKGVVASEMPPEFESEALKAQAVAARTYTMARVKKLFTSDDGEHKDADICTNSKHCQAWIDKDTFFKNYGNCSDNYWSKIDNAVSQTRGKLIYYNNQLINPVFHSSSGGKTDNVEAVWNCAPESYLKGVVSPEGSNGQFISKVDISISEFVKKLKNRYPKLIVNQKSIKKEISILEKTYGGRVKNIKIGNTKVSGNEFREIFDLKSTNFEIQTDSKKIYMKTIGYGHGVGMSQWGAEVFAKEGKSYMEILKYYYQGVEII